MPDNNLKRATSRDASASSPCVSIESRSPRKNLLPSTGSGELLADELAFPSSDVSEEADALLVCLFSKSRSAPCNFLTYAAMQRLNFCSKTLPSEKVSYRICLPSEISSL